MPVAAMAYTRHDDWPVPGRQTNDEVPFSAFRYLRFSRDTADARFWPLWITTTLRRCLLFYYDEGFIPRHQVFMIRRLPPFLMTFLLPFDFRHEGFLLDILNNEFTLFLPLSSPSFVELIEDYANSATGRRERHTPRRAKPLT